MWCIIRLVFPGKLNGPRVLKVKGRLRWNITGNGSPNLSRETCKTSVADLFGIALYLYAEAIL